MLAPLNLKRWIDEHRHLLKPPVGNAEIYPEADFIVMVVGGPNSRKDYHVDPGEELFYQLEGDMVLKVLEEGGPREIAIREGEMLLLPGLVPHSPQRQAKTVGLVIERKREAGELDLLRWYCERCHAVLHEASFRLVDITTQLKPVMESFYASASLRTCTRCGAVMEPPPPVAP